MDNKMLISMMGTTAPAREGSSTSKGGDVDADAFSKALEQATSGKSSGANENETIADKGTRKGSEAERRKEDAAEARLQKAEAKLNDPKAMVGSRAYLYHLVYKNPDSLSVAEKQALKTGEFSKDAVGLRDLQKMLADRGLHLRDLSFTQMADLTRKNSRVQVSSFLDHLVREQRKEDGKATGTPLAEAGAAAATNTSLRTPMESMLEGGLAVQASQKTEQGQQTAAARRRQEVIDQIVQQMELRNLADRDELHLKLNPEYLGELKIQLTHDANGEISARFLTTSEDTRQVLNESRSDLRQHVERRGIRMRDIDVDLVEELG